MSDDKLRRKDSEGLPITDLLFLFGCIMAAGGFGALIAHNEPAGIYLLGLSIASFALRLWIKN